jgi:hypothetical protein
MVRRSATAPERFAKGTQYQVLLGGANDPTWGAVDLTQASAVTGILGSANGGTGNGFAKISGPTTSEKTFTVPDVSANLHTNQAANSPKATALTDGATPALDASLGNFFTLSAAGDRTIAVPSNATAGQVIIIRHLASGGARTLALNTGAGGFRFGSDITGLTQTASGKYDYIAAQYNSTDSKWDVIAYAKGYG